MNDAWWYFETLTSTQHRRIFFNTCGAQWKELVVLRQRGPLWRKFMTYLIRGCWIRWYNPNSIWRWKFFGKFFMKVGLFCFETGLSGTFLKEMSLNLLGNVLFWFSGCDKVHSITPVLLKINNASLAALKATKVILDCTNEFSTLELGKS